MGYSVVTVVIPTLSAHEITANSKIYRLQALLDYAEDMGDTDDAQVLTARLEIAQVERRHTNQINPITALSIFNRSSVFFERLVELHFCEIRYVQTGVWRLPRNFTPTFKDLLLPACVLANEFHYKTVLVTKSAHSCMRVRRFSRKSDL
jgi:hypothetical protein